MTPITQDGVLPIGVEVDGVLHKDFTLRPALVEDNIEAINLVGSGNAVALNAAIFARQLMRLGSLAPKQISYRLVAGMHVADFDELDRKALELQKKLLLGGGTSSGGSPSEQPSPATESLPTTP
ncbi:MAG: hypothetical protein QM702_04505 [Rubrivivax sp.]